MDNHPTRRRPYGLVDGSSQPELRDLPVIPTSSTPFGYSNSPPLGFPQDQAGTLSTSVSFQGVLAHDRTLDFTQHYQQGEHFLQSQPRHYAQHHQTALHDPHPSFTQSSPRKRPRFDQDMSSYFLKNSARQNDQEIPPGSDFADEGGGRGSTMFQSLGQCFAAFCAPGSAYGAAPLYQAIPPTPIYEVAASRAYSADLQSPSQLGLPQYPTNMSIRREEETDFLVADSGDMPPALQEKYPIVQPFDHTDHPPTVQEDMRYPHPNSHHFEPKSEENTTFLKTEGLGQDLRVTDFPICPAFNHPVNGNYSHPGLANPGMNPFPQHPMERYQFIGPPHKCLSPESGEPQYFPPVPPEGDLARVVQNQKQNQKPVTIKRGPFKDQHKRQKTAVVRKIGSCIRCRMQRIRCEFDPKSPDDNNAPCDGCKSLMGNSKIHRMPCKRWKLTEVKLSKPGNVEDPDLQWTHRWKDSTTLPEITHWANDFDERKIYLSDGLGGRIPVKVRRFMPMDGDKTCRTWYHPVTGKKVEKQTQNFALVDVAATKDRYQEYLNSGQQQIFKKLLGPTEKLLWRTYDLAWRRKDNMAIEADERNLLNKTLQLWVCIRLTTRSFEIAGNETLGFEPDPKGKILLPPVMGQQLDKMLLDHILSKLRKETLKVLQSMTQARLKKTWLTTYLVSFILLHNVALITKHDKEYAEKHRMEDRTKQQRLIWARTDMVKQYHRGANIILAYFHYCNKGLYPFTHECKHSDLANLAELDDEAIDYIEWTKTCVEQNKRAWELMREDAFDDSTEPGANVRRADAYVDDYFFVSMLYQNHWSPKDSIIDKTAFRIIGPTRDSDRSST